MPNTNTNAITIAELGMEYDLPKDVSVKTNSYSSYIDQLKKINRLPFIKAEIYYSDNIWDFRKYTTLNVNKRALIFHFDNVAEAFRDDLKNYVLARLIENKLKIQSIHSEHGDLRMFFNYLAGFHIYRVDDIPQGLVKDYIEDIRINDSIVKLRTVKTTIKEFYLQYSINFHDITTPGIMALFEYDDHAAYEAHRLSHRTKDIPNIYFGQLLSGLLKIISDTAQDTIIRAVACVYIILSQTGLRIGEILGLRVESLKPVTLFDGTEANYLEYLTWKREHGNNTSTRERTYINHLSRQAFDTLVALYRDKRNLLNLDFLYMGNGRQMSSEDFPLSSEDFKKDAFDLIIKLDELGYLKTVDLPEAEYPTIHRFSSVGKAFKYISRPDENGRQRVNVVTFPDTQQFRFHCCTELYRKGVPLKYIQKFMSHLTNAMVKYHIYPEQSPQENMEYSVEMLKELLSGEVKILGNDRGLTERLQRYVDEKHPVRVKGDLDEICRELALTIPIREKTGGVCIKTSLLRDCSHDAATNEFYCAYGVCPNLVHFYYMADISYAKCKRLEKAITTNRIREQQLNRERAGSLGKAERIVYPKQIQKDINMLYSITTNQLIPELDDLERAIQEFGVDEIYSKHPEVQPIVENMESIRKEIAVWKTLK